MSGTIPVYNKAKIDKIKNSLCTGCKMGSCAKTPEMLSICQFEAFEFRLRTGRYNLGGNGNGAVHSVSKDIRGVIIDNVHVSIDDIKRLIVNRTDCYSLQNPKEPEKFPDVKEELTDGIILQSLLGYITIGIRPINPEIKKIKWICWDVDASENDNPKMVVGAILHCLKGKGLTGYVEQSGSNNSYHVWIFIEPIDNDLAFKFDEKFKNEVKILLAKKGAGDVYIDRGVHKGEKLGSGMIKMPFNIQRKNNVRSKFVNCDISKIQAQRLVIT